MLVSPLGQFIATQLIFIDIYREKKKNKENYSNWTLIKISSL